MAADLLSRVVNQPPEFLERLVLQLLVRMGYGGLETPSEHLGRSGDAGLEGLIRLDKLGLDVVYVQARRYTDRHVGRPDIQAFVGARHGAQASRGVFITTSRFSADAPDYADRVNARVVLIDGPELAALMIEHDCGVITEETYTLKPSSRSTKTSLRSITRGNPGPAPGRQVGADADGGGPSPPGVLAGDRAVTSVTRTSPPVRSGQESLACPMGRSTRDTRGVLPCRRVPGRRRSSEVVGCLWLFFAGVPA